MFTLHTKKRREIFVTVHEIF